MNHAVFTTYKKRALITWVRRCLESPHIPVPGSLNLAVFPTYRKRGFDHLTHMVFAVHTDTSPRVTEPRGFKTYRKRVLIMWLRRYLESPWILDPESLNLAYFTTYRKRAFVVPVITMDTSPRITEPCSSHHLQKEGFVHMTQKVLGVPMDSEPRTLNLAVFATYIYMKVTLVVPVIIMNTSPRITEPCSFHQHSERGLLSHDSYSVRCPHRYTSPRITEPCSFTTYRQGLWSCNSDVVRCPHGQVPESLLQFLPPTERGIVSRDSDGTWSTHGFRSQNHWTL